MLVVRHTRAGYSVVALPKGNSVAYYAEEACAVYHALQGVPPVSVPQAKAWLRKLRNG